MASTTAIPASTAPLSSPVVGSDLVSVAERQPQPEERSEEGEAQEEETYLRDTDLGPHDVLLGRGAPFLNYAGNRRFRAYVGTQRNIYGAARRNRIKNEIARRVVDEIVGRRGGRFLVCVADAAADAAASPSRRKSSLSVPPGTRRLWKLAEDDVILEKCKQALRDKDPEEGSASSSKKKNSTQTQEQPGVRTAAAAAADGLSSAIASKKRKSPSSFSSHHHDHATETMHHHQQYHHPDEETNSMRYRATTPIRTSSHSHHHRHQAITMAVQQQPAAAATMMTMPSQPLEQQLWPTASFLPPMVQWVNGSNGPPDLTRQDHHSRPPPPVPPPPPPQPPPQPPLLTDVLSSSSPLAAWIGALTAAGIRSAPGPFARVLDDGGGTTGNRLLPAAFLGDSSVPPTLAQPPLRQLPSLYQVQQPEPFSQLLSLSQQLHLPPPPPLQAAMSSLHHSLQHLTGRALQQGHALPTPIPPGLPSFQREENEDDLLSLALLAAATERQQIMMNLQDLRRQHQRELHQLLHQLLSPLPSSPATTALGQHQHSVSDEHAPVNGNGHHYH